MSSLPKLAVVSLVVFAIGALQIAVPAFNSKPTANLVSHIKTSEPLQTNDLPTSFEVADYQNVQSGTLYFVEDKFQNGDQHKQHLLSPVLNTEVAIQITGIVARSKVTQTFKNDTQDWVNALYVFPLPENAAVDHLLMTVGTRKIEGVIKQKSVAKKIFQQAKATGKKASLVAQLRPNMFSNSIANIGPGESITVSIEYQQTLSFDKQQYSLRFPMTITPRYSPKGNNQALPNSPEFSDESQLKLERSIDLQVNLHSGFDIKNITSEFHEVSVKTQADGSQQIDLSKGNIANQDFVLTWQPELGAEPQSAHFTQLINGDEYGLIMLLPPIEQPHEAQTPPREVIFVLDTSGSMEGDSIQQAKQALLLAIDKLNSSDTFNIIEFNSYAQNLWHNSSYANPENKQDAKDFVNSLSANGGTEMASALKLALRQAKSNSAEHLRQVVFITDGSVSNEASLMQLIEQRLGDTRLFTVGIGSAPNSYFMTEAAEMGKGTFTYIGSVAQVQEKMLKLLTKLQHPALTDIQLQTNNTALQSNPSLEFYPKTIGDLYQGEPLVLSYKLSDDKIESISARDSLENLSLSGLYQKRPWTTAINLNTSSRQSGLNVLWAREKISQLSRDKRRAAMEQNSDKTLQDEFKSQIIDTALTHHLVSRYTSLVAVDVTPTRPETSQAKDQRVANSLPKGASKQLVNTQGQLPQTATTAQLKILFGLLFIGLALCMHLLTKRKVVSQNSFL